MALWDEPGGYRDQMHAAARNHRGIAKLVPLGTTYQGRELLALKLTAGARGVRDGRRPAVLYSSTQHAREWIANEVNRRLMNGTSTAAGLGPRDQAAAPDDGVVVHSRGRPRRLRVHVRRRGLWRKNLRDNNDDGQITVGDGVDPNRNFPNHFNYDEEGSSSITSSDTYRGPAPVSEPETGAMKGLLDRIGFEFQVNWHSNGQWLLYAEGWQIATPTADDPIYFALSGNLDRPAIRDFHPGLSSDVLYVTNGETTDYAHAGSGALAWTPELSAGCPTAGSCSRTTRRSCRRSSSATCRSRCPWPSRRATRTTRNRSSASRPSRSTPRATTRTRTGSRASTSSSTTPTVIPSRSRSWQSAPRPRDAQVPDQRRGRAECSDLGVGRWRAL